MERTLFIIQPEGMSKETEIISTLLSKGFKILNVSSSPDNRDAVDLFQPFMEDSKFNAFIQNITSGPILGLLLSKPGIHADLDNLIGPIDDLKWDSSSLRGKYGQNSLRNGFYKSDAEYSERDILFFFPSTYAEKIASFDVSKSFIEDSVYPTLLKGLTELAKVKPESPHVWLSQWLMENNPHKPRVEEP